MLFLDQYMFMKIAAERKEQSSIDRKTEKIHLILEAKFGDDLLVHNQIFEFGNVLEV